MDDGAIDRLGQADRRRVNDRQARCRRRERDRATTCKKNKKKERVRAKSKIEQDKEWR